MREPTRPKNEISDRTNLCFRLWQKPLRRIIPSVAMYGRSWKKRKKERKKPRIINFHFHRNGNGVSVDDKFWEMLHSRDFNSCIFYLCSVPLEVAALIYIGVPVCAKENGSDKKFCIVLKRIGWNKIFLSKKKGKYDSIPFLSRDHL